MDIMYLVAKEMMKRNLPFILENNFENISRKPLLEILEEYHYRAITMTLTGDYKKLYQHYVKRNHRPQRRRGHVVNDRYPEENPNCDIQLISNGPHIIIDTTDFNKVDQKALIIKIEAYMKQLG